MTSRRDKMRNSAGHRHSPPSRGGTKSGCLPPPALLAVLLVAVVVLYALTRSTS